MRIRNLCRALESKNAFCFSNSNVISRGIPMQKLVAFMAFLLLVLMCTVSQAANGYLEAYANHRGDAVASRANLLVICNDADIVVAAAPAHPIVHEDDGTLYKYVSYSLVVDGDFVPATPDATYISNTLDLALIVFPKTPELANVTAVALAPSDAAAVAAQVKEIACTTGNRNPGRVEKVGDKTMLVDFEKDVVRGESGAGVISGSDGRTLGIVLGFLEADPSKAEVLRLTPNDVKGLLRAIKHGGVPRGFVELDMNR